ncbi:hypothetical protein ATN88_07565 [Enterovibrio coralii]|uniref:Pyruvate flavodoxin/ferredoxin oxidoreductase pyrimidine binding domain-containing protein n=1 Tax=Enterovibrio coralii TaxID=294935 RepID=A0A135I530_9GAMM|nr:hypothetical protein ATN88_07565 [Enterovibrio coralii]
MKTVPKLISGAERVANALHCARTVCARAYPGTPATAIFESFRSMASEVLDVEWAINEKVALEEAGASAMLGLRSVCVMKHYGLNVCADFLAAIALTDYLPGGLLILVGDDPSGTPLEASRTLATMVHCLGFLS